MIYSSWFSIFHLLQPADIVTLSHSEVLLKGRQLACHLVAGKILNNTSLSVCDLACLLCSSKAEHHRNRSNPISWLKLRLKNLMLTANPVWRVAMNNPGLLSPSHNSLGINSHLSDAIFIFRNSVMSFFLSLSLFHRRSSQILRS